MPLVPPVTTATCPVSILMSVPPFTVQHVRPSQSRYRNAVKLRTVGLLLALWCVLAAAKRRVLDG